MPWHMILPLLAAGMVICLWLAWHSAREFGRPRREWLMFLRLLGLSGLAFCFLNPGQWHRPEEASARRWVLLLDHTGSMNTPDGDPEGATRWQTAARAAGTLLKARPETTWRLFADELEISSNRDALTDTHAPPRSRQSDLYSATSTLLGASSNKELAGLVILSDGRQTTTTKPDDTLMRARALQVPIHAMVVGGQITPKDIELQATRRQLIAFPGQTITLGASLTAQGLGDVRTSLSLSLKGESSPLETRDLTLTDGEPRSVIFDVVAPDVSSSYTLTTPVWEGEQRETNNGVTIHVRILDSKTRVFLAEGAPYWDSKFLAQLFRQQPYVQLRSVHRLSDTRFFQIDSEQEEPVATDQDTFPETAEALAAYDLVAFGKGIEPFITASRLEALRSYVRDHGGALLFARGRAYAGRHPGLASLEPVTWKESRLDSFHFLPAPEGESAGLFGESLPGAKEALWSQLPPLQDAQEVDSVKPFTRVLAHGTLPNANPGTTGFPLLSVRRYGLGVVGLVNADGLWKWDFFPEARSSGNMYEEFWSQLIQWMASYSEFLPGQQYSMRLNTNQTLVGDLVSVTLGWRPESNNQAQNAPDAVPIIHLARQGSEETLTHTPAAVRSDDGRPQWRANLSLDSPGEWLLHLQGAEGEALNGPELVLTVSAPPGEQDQLDADPARLQALAEATGGRLWSASEVEELAAIMEPPPAVLAGDLQWDAWWLRWPWLLALTFCFALEWWFRRRWGSV